MIDLSMKRVMATVNHPIFISEYEKITDTEQNRIFCKHNIDHFIDVARIAYILSMERNLFLDKEIIYVTALLHDIGRSYDEHEVASAQIAGKILEEAGFDSSEIKEICDAVSQHRRGSDTTTELAAIINEADKLSRRCFDCPAVSQCNWNDDLKNMSIKY